MFLNTHLQKMVQLTRDQTFLNYLAEIGAELPEDPETDSRRSILTQAVGTSETIDVKVTYTKLRQGDRLLPAPLEVTSSVWLSDLAPRLT